MKKKTACFVIALVFCSGLLLGSCGTVSEAQPESKAGETESVTEQPQTESDTVPKETEETHMPHQLSPLALCITEGGVPLDASSVNARFREYRELGLTSVRLDLYFTNSNGRLRLAEESKNQFRAARKYGLKLKVIINPGGTAQSDPDSKLVDAAGRTALNAVSPWYANAETYTESFVRDCLKTIQDEGFADLIGGIVAGLGPAGEPLYPPAWTQGGGDEVLWCYADNAQSDFRSTMQDTYGTIDKANEAWGTSYASFEDISIPKEDDFRGQYLRDVLEWYRDSKRTFMDMQVRVFRSVIEELNLSDLPLILYLPGADFTEKQWESCIRTGRLIDGIRFMCDNTFTVQLARKYDCFLQYTGITGTDHLRSILIYMRDEGYSDIPVFGENAGGSLPDAQPGLLRDIILEYKLSGIDYTHCHWLFESDGRTRSEVYEDFASIVPELESYLKSGAAGTYDPSADSEDGGSPEGDILAFTLHFSKPESEPLAFAFATLKKIDFVIRDGDTLEYDVYLSDAMAGLGAIDGNFSDGKTLRDNYGLTDTTGLRIHPNADLSDRAAGQWYHRIIRLGTAQTDGQHLTLLQLAAHPEDANDPFTVCDVTVYYDNIVIMRDGEIVLTVFADEGDVTPASASVTKFASGQFFVTDISETD